jgi:uncharacterized phage protein gp47/JayE
LYQKAFLRILSKVLGGVWVLLYQYIGFVLLQMFVKTASNKPVSINGREVTPLKEWGAARNIVQDAGRASEHTVTVTVLSQGGTLQSGTRLADTATEIIYNVIGAVSLNAATVTATVRSDTPGEASNLSNGAVLSFVNALAGVAKDVVVASRTVEGVDEETTEEFRQKVADVYAAPPQGGAYADYRAWAQDVVGVKNAYPYSGGTFSGSGAGHVDVYIEASTGTDGIPTQGLLDDVLEAINYDVEGIANRRPLNDYVNVLPISRVEFVVRIGNLVNSTPEAIAAIEAGLESYFVDRAPFILGLTVLPRKDIVSIFEIGGVVGRLASSLGTVASGIVLKQNSVNIETYSLQEGQKAKLVDVEWP